MDKEAERKQVDTRLLEDYLKGIKARIKEVLSRCRCDTCGRFENGAGFSKTEEGAKRMQAEMKNLADLYSHKSHIEKLIDGIETGDIDHHVTLQELCLADESARRDKGLGRSIIDSQLLKYVIADVHEQSYRRSVVELIDKVWRGKVDHPVTIQELLFDKWENLP